MRKTQKASPRSPSLLRGGARGGVSHTENTESTEIKCPQGFIEFTLNKNEQAGNSLPALLSASLFILARLLKGWERIAFFTFSIFSFFNFSKRKEL